MDLVSLPPSTAPPAGVHGHGGGCSLLPGAKPSLFTHAVCSLSSFSDWLRHLPGHIEHMTQHYVWPHVPAAGLTLLTLVVAWRAARAVSLRRAVADGWQARIIPPRAVDPAQAGQVWDLLAALVRRAARWRIAAPPVAFEVWARDGELTARLWLPARIPQPAVADVAAQAWPGARVEADAPPGLVSEGRAVVAAWRLSSSVPESRWLVRSDLATAAISRRDAGAGWESTEPLRSVLSGLASAPVPALLQVLVRPAPRRRRAALRHAASHGGRPTAPLVIRLLRSVLNLLQRVPARPPAGPGRPADPFAAQAVREAADKIAARPELLASIRVRCTARTHITPTSPNPNQPRPAAPAGPATAGPARPTIRPVPAEQTKEMMTLTRPDTSPAPARRRRLARMTLVPPGSPRRMAVKPLGTAPLASPVLVGLSVPDARHHVHVLGPTGTGKSTLLVNLVCAEARAGRGVAVFDPKGDLVRDLLHRLPEPAGKRLVVIDPDEQQAPPSVNLLGLGSDPEAAATQVAGVMGKVWAQYWGPRTDDLARHAVLTLAHLPGATLADLPALLADSAYRRRVMSRLRRTAEPAQVTGLAAFWAWWDQLTPAQASVQAGPLLSKLRAVLSRRFAADLFGTAASTFRLPDILDGGILLARLPKGVLGEDTVRLVGSLLLAALLQAAGARAGQAEDERADATVVIDECHNFLHLPIGLEDALAEARGLRVSLVLAHQNLGQLTTHATAAVDANARNKLLFALAPDDARHLAHHVEPYFAAEDLTRRDAYGIVARLVIDGRDGEPFSLHTRPAPPPWPGRAEALRAAARTWGLPAAERQALAEARRLGPAARDLPRAADPDSDQPDIGDASGRHPAAPPPPVSPPRHDRNPHASA